MIHKLSEIGLPPDADLPDLIGKQMGSVCGRASFHKSAGARGMAPGGTLVPK